VHFSVRRERDIVYLQGPVPAQPAPRDGFAAKNAATDSWAITLTPDPVMLMRFSALTFNAHLIHFDQLYTQREEAIRNGRAWAFSCCRLGRLLALNQVDDSIVL